MVRLILFDIDGTLIHTRGAGVKAFNKTLAAEFGIQDGLGQVQFAGRTDPSIVRELFQLHRIDSSAENIQRFFDRYVFWLDYLLCKTAGEICAGVWNFIHQVKALPNPPLLGLLTGNIRLGAEIKLRHYQLWEAFLMGAFGDDHEDRCALAEIARERGSQISGQTLVGNQVVVVGDTPLDIGCAKAIQARMLAVATGIYSANELAAHGPTWAVSSLNELNAREICA